MEHPDLQKDSKQKNFTELLSRFELEGVGTTESSLDLFRQYLRLIDDTLKLSSTKPGS